MRWGGATTAAVLWARRDVRARWRSLVVLGVLAGVTAGLALACLDGAERTSTALERLREQTLASDAVVFASQVGVSHPDWRPLAARPEVKELATWALVFGILDGDPGGVLFAPVGDTWLHSVDRPIMVTGRMFDPSADDEVIVSVSSAKAAHVGVGDTLAFQPATDADLATMVSATDGGDSHGPKLRMRIVGTFKTSIDYLFITDGFGVISPGVLQAHPEVGYHENAYVRLRSGDASVAALQRHADTDITSGTPLLDLQATARRVTTTTDVERSVLLILALVIAVAGLVLVGQAVVRSSAGVSADSRSLHALGMARRHVALAPTLSHLVPAIVALATGTATLAIASTWVPFGIAGDLDPDRGVQLDPLTAALGLVGVAAALVAGAYLGGWRAARATSGAQLDESRGVAGWVRRHATPTVGIGTTMAVRPGRGRREVPVRPAILGAIVGVLGIAAASTVQAGLQDAVDHPERAGVAWDAEVAPMSESGYTERGLDPGFVAAERAVPQVADLAQVDRGNVQVDGLGVPTFAVRPADDQGPTSSIELVLLDGRGPRRPGEVALGPSTEARLGLGVGDSLQVGPDGTELEVVGTALFPSDVHSAFDEGAWLSPADYDAVADPEAGHRYLAVRLAPGVATTDGLKSMIAAGAAFSTDAVPPDVPPELLNLRDVLPLPRYLAGFLALLAVAALLHVLTTSARARRHDFAVLRALGMTPRDTRLVLNVQGLAVFTVGLLLGIPLGVAAGRVAWSHLADRVPLDDIRPLGAVALLLLVPATLVLSQVLAFEPGRRVRRLRPAEVLRTE